MPLRWSYESVIISQAKLNPLTRAQEMLEDRIQTLINLPRDIPMTEKQRSELDLTKQALAVVSGLQDSDADTVVRRLDEIREGIKHGSLALETLEGKGRKGVSAEEIFVNRKVLDLVTKAEMEREDYRRKASPNVFFGTYKTLWSWKEPQPDGTITDKSFKVRTLWINFAVMLLMFVVTVGSLNFTLRRQLRKV